MHCNRLLSGRSRKMPVKKVTKYSKVREKDISLVSQLLIIMTFQGRIQNPAKHPNQTSNMKLFAEIVNGFQLLSTFA